MKYLQAVYQVMSWGDHRKDLFQGSEHGQLFTNTIREACLKVFQVPKIAPATPRNLRL